MENDRMGKLADIAHVLMGTSPPGDTTNTVGSGIPLLNGPTEFGSRSPVAVQFTDAPVKECEKGDILFCVRGSTTGRMNIADKQYAIGRGLAAIRHRNGTRFQPYVKGLIEVLLPKLLAVSNGSTFPSVSKIDIENLKIKLPPVNVQERIADILGTLDDKIELNRRTNETLEAIAKALFESWFVDFDPVREKAAGRKPAGLDPDTAKLFPNSFVDSPLGKIPKGWRVGTIKELTSKIQYGLTQSANNDRVGPHFLRITDIQGGRVHWADVPYCQASAEETDRYRIQPGDVFVARTGASTGENVFIIKAPKAVFASYLVRFQFSEACFARLVGEFMRTTDYFDFVASCLGGSAQPNASAQVLASATLIVPDSRIAEKFKMILEPLDQQRCQNDDESQNLAAIRDVLLPKLLSGEICSP